MTEPAKREVLPAPAQANQPSDEDVIASAEVAIAEARRHIDFQVKQADALDTRTAAVMTLAAGAAGLSVGRLHVETDVQLLSALAGLAVLVVLLTCAIQALRPRGGWSYGADPRDVAEKAAQGSHRAVLRAFALALAEAREKNVIVLNAKHGYYRLALFSVAAFLLALGGMLGSGALGD